MSSLWNVSRFFSLRLLSSYPKIRLRILLDSAIKYTVRCYSIPFHFCLVILSFKAKAGGESNPQPRPLGRLGIEPTTVHLAAGESNPQPRPLSSWWIEPATDHLAAGESNPQLAGTRSRWALRYPAPSILTEGGMVPKLKHHLVHYQRGGEGERGGGRTQNTFPPIHKWRSICALHRFSF